MALLLRSAGSLGPSLLGRDNSRGTLQQGKGASLQIKVVQQLANLMGDVTAATDVCGRSAEEVFVRYLWEQGFWSVRCCGKTHSGHGVMFIRWKRDQRSGGASSKGRRMTPAAKGLNATPPQGGFAAGWMTQFGCFGKSESGAGKNH